MFASAMERIQANEMIKAIQSSSYPDMKPQAQKDLRRRLQKVAGLIDERPLTHEDMERLLNG